MSNLPALHDLTALDARDRLVLALNLGVPFPLRALPLDYPPKVDVGQVAGISIRRAQAGVRYRLCDEDGNAINGSNGQPVDRAVAADPGEDGLELPTPPVTADITYSVLASRLARPELAVEAYLALDVPIKVGIDDRLPLRFIPGEEDTLAGNELTVPYGARVRVVVSQTQEGVSYQLYADAQPETRLSDPVRGDTDDIELLSGPLTEDTPLKVRAYRTATPQIVSTLTARLRVHVRPNPDIPIDIAPAVLDYRSSVRITLRGTQSSAAYHLFRRDLTPAEYVAAADAGGNGLNVATPEGRNVTLSPLPVSLNGDQPEGFVLVGAFTAAGQELTLTTDPLAEDTLLVVRASKKDNPAMLLTRPLAAVLVRPNPAPQVGVRQSPIDSGAEGVVTVDSTQSGVAYQLRSAGDNQAVGLPGFHLGDRGIESERVEVDLVVGEQGQDQLWLPTGPLTATTRFGVLAVKRLTGVSQALTGQVAVVVKGTADPVSPPTLPEVGTFAAVPSLPSGNAAPAAGSETAAAAAEAPGVAPAPKPVRKPSLRKPRKVEDDTDRAP